MRKLKAHFVRNGPQYKAQTFKRFSESYEFQHITPGYSQSNDKAESDVNNEKFIRTADMAKYDIFLAILNHRYTPNESGYSPAQCLMSRHY